MKIHLFDDDVRRKTDPNYFWNKGSFAQITDGINAELEKLGLYASEKEADIVGFASGLKLRFGFDGRRRFLIHVFETNILPQFIVDWRKNTDTQVFGLSRQISETWDQYGFNTPVVDIGCDADFWKPLDTPKNEKFTVLSVTSLNFRSGVDTLLKAFSFLHINMGENVRLIIKNTDERNLVLPKYIQSMRASGMDVEYICERQTSQQIRELYNQSHVLVYIPVNTSAGLPILEAGACELPVLVGDYCPTNIYPVCEKVPVHQISLDECRQRLKYWQFPYTFPEGCLDETKAMMNWMNFTDLARSLLKIKNNHDIYKMMAKEARKEIQEKWTWKHSCDQLLHNLNLQ